MTKQSPTANSEKKLSELIPEHISNVLGKPALLPFESVDGFNKLFTAMIVHFDPQELVEYVLVREITQHQMEISHLTSMRHSALELALPAAAIQLMKAPLQRFLDTEHITEEDVRPTIHAAIEGSEEDRQAIGALGKEAGVSLQVLQAAAFSKSLETISSIEDMISMRERRRDQLVKALEERRGRKSTMSNSAQRLKRRADDVEVPDTDS